MKPRRLLNTWSPEDIEHLVTLALAGRTDAEIAGELGRSPNAVGIRRLRTMAPIDGRRPKFGTGIYGTRYWTAEQVLAGLRDFARTHRGPLPTSDHVYNRMKKGHMEWPTAARVLEYHGTMPDAWQAAGVSRSRYHRSWVEWTQEDDDYLLDHAGLTTLKNIAKHLGRSWPACKRRLYDLEAGRARDVSGYLSMAQVSQEYGCPITRVKKLIRTGELPARRVTGGHYFRIDPMDCERVKHLLMTPKKTHITVPPDQGDYRRRYGLRRTRVAS